MLAYTDIPSNCKILIITYSYFPAITPRAFRWTSIAEYLARRGCSVDVLCAASGKFVDPQQEILENITIYRTRDLVSDIKTKTAVNKNHRSMMESAIANLNEKGLLKRLYDVTWKKIYWPDYTCLWMVNSITVARKLLLKNKYHAIITVSLPFSSHLIGYILKSKFGEATWIVDIGDPFSFTDTTPPNNFLLYRRLNFWIEQQLLCRASFVSVTTDETRCEYIKQFHGFNPVKIITIPPLLPTSNLLYCNESNQKSETMKMVFVGTLYKGIRNPIYLLRVLEKLRGKSEFLSLTLHFVGMTDDQMDLLGGYRHYLGEWLHCEGQVSRTDALSFIQNADILVNIGNQTYYQLPSKIVEYMATGKPIVNIASTEDDSSRRVLSGYPPSITLFTSESLEISSERLATFLCSVKSVNRETVDTLLEPYTVQSIGNKYLSLLLTAGYE